jgi:hypothetical protein
MRYSGQVTGLEFRLPDALGGHVPRGTREQRSTLAMWRWEANRPARDRGLHSYAAACT